MSKKLKHRQKTPELAFDVCDYFTDDIYLNFEIGKFLIYRVN